MRVGKYLADRNIGIRSINNLCDFLHLDHVKINSKLSEAKTALLDTTLNAQPFQDWLEIRVTLDKIEVNDAKNTIKPLFFGSTIQVDDLMGERILNALMLLINRSFYLKAKESLLQILSADRTILEKISLLKISDPFTKPKETSTAPMTTKTVHKSDSNDYDPYENFHWGGLSGEEAYVGYWNTD